MYDVAEILKYYNEYGSIREVQRQTGISRNTIAKYYNAPPNQYRIF